jgi:hypothetical protein
MAIPRRRHAGSLEALWVHGQRPWFHQVMIGTSSTTQVAPSAIYFLCFSETNRSILLSEAWACSQATAASLSPP